MIHVSVKDTINAPADNVWKTVGAISNVEQYIPMIKSSTVQGSGLGAKRTCIVTNEKGEEMGKLEEDIIDFNEGAKTYSYAITSGPFPVENYVGTVKVMDLGNNTSEIEWSSECEAKGMTDEEVSNMLHDVYSSIINGLKKIHN
jgi:carbon monoxide dehydrogenase subunit G